MGFPYKEEWLKELEDKERELQGRRTSILKEKADLEAEYAKLRNSAPKEAAAIHSTMREADKIIEKIDAEVKEAGRKYFFIRPQYSELSIIVFAFFMAFVLAFPEIKNTPLDSNGIFNCLALLVAYFLAVFLAFFIIDYCLSWARKAEKWRKAKALVTLIAACAIYAFLATRL